jgi:hypothetical protein
MKKVLEKSVINNRSNGLVFGKCFFEQRENQIDFINEYLTSYKHLNISYDHSPFCPLKGLYENKKEKDSFQIQEHFNELKTKKNKYVSLASVGIIYDKFVSIFNYKINN